MEEASVDVSVLLSDRKEDSFQSNVVLQSDRGLWQLCHWIIFMLTALCCSWQTFSPAFLVPVSDCISAAPDLRDERYTVNSTNWTSPSSKIGGIHEVGSCFAQLMISNCSGRNYSAASANDSVIAKCSLTEADESTDIAHKMVFLYGKKYLIAVAKSIYMLGSFVAVILIVFMVNRFGQRCTVFCGFLTFYLCAVTASFAASVGTFVTLRFFLSLGITSVYWITLQAMLESVVSDYRLLYVVTGHLGWAVGYMILPAVAWCTTDWFSFQVSGSVPCLLLAIPLSFFPESVNYFLRRGKVKEAIDALKAALKKNGQNMDDINEICHQSHRNFMKKSHDSEENACRRLQAHLRYRNLIFYAASFTISLLYYAVSWDFYHLPGDPFASFAWAGVMETLACLLLVFFGYFVPQRLLLFLMAMGASIFPAVGIIIATGEAGVPVCCYMAAKFFATGAVLLTVIRAFEALSLTVTAVAMSIGAAVAPLLDEMIVDRYYSMMMTAACITSLILEILLALFPLRPPKCSLHNPLSSSDHS